MIRVPLRSLVVPSTSYASWPDAVKWANRLAIRTRVRHAVARDGRRWIVYPVDQVARCQCRECQ